MSPNVSRARASLAARLLVDTCRITRPALSATLNPTTLALVDEGSVIYEGSCYVNVRATETDARFVSVEALGRTDTKVRVRLPLSCPELRNGDEIEILTSDTADLVGALLDVVEDAVGSYTVSKLVRARIRKRTA